MMSKHRHALVCTATAVIAAVSSVRADDPRVTVLETTTIEPEGRLVQIEEGPAPVSPVPRAMPPLSAYMPAPDPSSRPPSPLLAPARLPLNGPEPWSWIVEVSEQTRTPVFATPSFMRMIDGLPPGPLNIARANTGAPPNYADVLDMIAALTGAMWEYRGGIGMRLIEDDEDVRYVASLRPGTLRDSIARIARDHGYSVGAWGLGSPTEGYDLSIHHGFYFLADHMGTHAVAVSGILEFFGRAYGFVSRVNDLDRTIDIEPMPGRLTPRMIQNRGGESS